MSGGSSAISGASNQTNGVSNHFAITRSLCVWSSPRVSLATLLLLLAARRAQKRPRPQRRPTSSTDPSPVTYADLGGIEHVLDDITELIVFPMAHPEVYTWLGVLPPRGVLLHGPPGCGKTALANAIANECGVPFLRVSAPEIVSGMSGVTNGYSSSVVIYMPRAEELGWQKLRAFHGGLGCHGKLSREGTLFGQDKLLG